MVAVTAREKRTQSQSAEVHLVAVVKPGVGEFAVTGRRRQHLCPIGDTELVCAGKEVGMQVRVGGERHSQTKPGGGRMHGAQVTAHIDDECTSVAEVDEVGGI